jgi:hypothetical protein
MPISDELTNYLAFLHDVISAYHERLSEVTSPQVARELLANLADKEVRYLKLNEQADPSLAVESFLKKMGMDHKVEKKGEVTTVSLACPNACTVHPRITSPNLSNINTRPRCTKNQQQPPAHHAKSPNHDRSRIYHRTQRKTKVDYGLHTSPDSPQTVFIPISAFSGKSIKQ